MTTLRILDIDGYFKHIELYDNDAVNLKYQFTNLEQIQSATSSFSQTFRVPATKNNMEIFGAMFNTNIVGGYDVKKKKQAFIEVDTIPVISGFIQLKNVYIQKEVYSDFEIAFFGEGADLSKTLASKLISDLDLSAYDHTATVENIQDSWTGDLFAGKIRYGIIDKGQNWSQVSGTPINALSPIYAGELTPFFRVYELTKEILKQNGFYLTSDFLSAQTNFYLPCSNGNRFLNTSIPYDAFRFLATLGTTNDVTLSSGNTVGSINAVEVYDPENLYTSNYFTPIYPGDFTFVININVENQTAGNCLTQILIANNADLTDNQVVFSQMVTQGNTVVTTAQVTATLTAGEEYSLYYNLLGQSGGTFSINAGTSWTLTFAAAPFFGQTVSISNNLPKITQIDFLRSIQKMFNLVFIPDRLDATKISIEPYESYISTGTIKDWTSILDYSKDVVISPTVDLQFRRYEWTYSEEKDILNDLYKTQTDRVYGRYLIEDSENEFSTGEYKVQPSFGAYPCTYIGGTTIIIHKGIDSSGQIIKDPKAKVVYWGGLQPCDTIYLNDGSNTALTSYPYFNHYSTTDVQFDDVDLNFGGEIPVFPIQVNPLDNLYRTYWADYVNDLYSSSSRILTAYFKLSISDIATFRFNDQIWLKDSYWRILEIDYSPNSNDVTKVKLIKLLSGANICDLTPVSGSQSGQVNFVDADGDPALATKVCCEFYGYVYVNNSCFQPLGQVIENNEVLYNSVTPPFSFAQGQNIDSPTRLNLLLGYDITNRSNAGVVVGNAITTAAVDYIHATGSNVNAFVEGVHRGNGWWHENLFSGNRGAAQQGQVTFIYEGAFDDNAEVELFIEGKENNRLNIPDNSSMFVRFDVVISTNDGTYAENTQTLVFYEAYKKVNRIAGCEYTGHGNTPVLTIGDFGTSTAAFHIETDVTTDTDEHRVFLHNHSVTNTSTTRIVCTMNYVISTW
jgi:hypothetical protein